MVKTAIFQLLSLALLCHESTVTAQTDGLQAYVTADQGVEQTKLTNARNTWNTRLYSNYNYDFSAECPSCYLGLYPWRVQLTPGQPASALNSKNDAQAGALSIAQTFDKIQSHLTNPNDLVVATYDANNGYPTSYSIQQGSIQSDIIAYKVSGFETQTGSQQQLYEANRNKWAGTRIRDYDFQYEELGPNPEKAVWPFFVKVRGGVVVETKDNNGNKVLWMTPLSFDQYFDYIERQLSAKAPYIDNSYDQYKGFANDIFMITTANTHVETKFFNYKDTGLTPPDP